MRQKSLPVGASDTEIRPAQRMEIVGQLTGGIVHDFNNIFTVIAGTIEILAEAVAGQPELEVVARLISEATTRGASLASHLLAFARGSPSEPRDVDVNSLLVDAIRLLRPTLGERIEIVSAPAAEVSPAMVDPSVLMAGVLHLAIMARDAMPEGGKLIFETRNAASGEGGVGEGGRGHAEDDVMVGITASGHRTCCERLDRMLMGPNVSQDLIAQINGRVKICSQAARGTTSIKIYLPRATDSIQPRAEDPGETGNAAILIVEDDILVRNYVITQVQSLGYRTFAASNAEEALAIFDSGASIDLLFADIVMPGSISGRRLVIEARSRRPLLKVLYTSGYAESAPIQDGRIDADALLLAKPYRKADLAKMIRAALAA
jgi:CheY-like chemotaxis protein